MAVRLISVGYGHTPSGKLYDYETTKQYRTGDVVVVPVTHHKSKKTYNTLGVVMQTHTGQDEIKRHTDYLESNRNMKGQFKKQVEVKDVSMRLEVAKRQGMDVTSDRQVNITTLPGYATRASDGNWSGVERGASRLISRN